MIIEIHHEHPQPRRITEALRRMGTRAGLIAYPTDTVYAIGCRVRDKDAVSQLQRLKAERGEGGLWSIIGPDLSAISEYAVVEGPAYRVLRRALPGAFTFVLRATKQVPKLLQTRQKTIGVRVPDSAVALALCEALGGVMVTTSAKGPEGQLLTTPREIEEHYRGKVKVILDAGALAPQPSTVVDLTTTPPEVLRNGAGDLGPIGLE